MSEWNDKIISEFRANQGRVGGSFAKSPILLLHHLGRRTGMDRVTPVMYLRDADRLVVFASNNGATRDPEWYRNLVANPSTVIEVGEERLPVSARVAEGDERSQLWANQVAQLPDFADYAAKAGRVIPVVVLEKR